jgi:hypothetical protein
MEVHMAFVQIIDFRTSKIDEMRKAGEEWEQRAASEGTARRVVLCADRDNPGHYMNVVFFDSFEEAMKNSELPLTQEMSKRMMALGDGPPTFYNLDVLDDRSIKPA